MEEWMDTRATYGNNPYMRMPKPSPILGRQSRRGRGRIGRNNSAFRSNKKLKSLFVYDEGLRTSEVQSAVGFIVGLEEDEETTEDSNSRISEEFAEEMTMTATCRESHHSQLPWWARTSRVGPQALLENALPPGKSDGEKEKKE
jgi:hypothetical protein